jgi:hypothetical protein
MARADFEQTESSQRQHNDLIQHYEEMAMLGEKRILMFISELKPKLSKDGNQWCFLWGENLQEGIAGFGETPLQAAADFLNEFEGVKK